MEYFVGDHVVQGICIEQINFLGIPIENDKEKL